MILNADINCCRGAQQLICAPFRAEDSQLLLNAGQGRRIQLDAAGKLLTADFAFSASALESPLTTSVPALPLQASSRFELNIRLEMRT
jgi:hypothetical protein